ncbi:DNA adenine methylase [Roseibium sp. HPY-6]|uniref:DNA adenine methylase n=1 Tax=Roseibium sp. HPY-6 TaxID=3229852 RepID=UPI00338E653F
MLTSPLRYPGGKAKLFHFFTETIKCNSLFSKTYCEPYAGGAGLALKLLSSGFIDSVALNDIDESIFAFWHSVLRRPDDFCELIQRTPITIEEWYRQKSVWESRDLSCPLSLGFAAFFLNRTNRSGIIEGAGPIGGYEQAGAWKLDVRLNKDQQIKNIENLKCFSYKIDVTNSDALNFTKKKLESKDTFLYLDPPYYVKGSKLYRNFYNHQDHENIHDMLLNSRNGLWVVSYDDVPQIREIYGEFSPVSYSLHYSAGKKTTGREIIYFSDKLVPPLVEGFEPTLAA